MANSQDKVMMHPKFPQLQRALIGAQRSGGADPMWRAAHSLAQEIAGDTGYSRRTVLGHADAAPAPSPRPDRGLAARNELRQRSGLPPLSH